MNEIGGQWCWWTARSKNLHSGRICSDPSPSSWVNMSTGMSGYFWTRYRTRPPHPHSSRRSDRIRRHNGIFQICEVKERSDFYVAREITWTRYTDESASSPTAVVFQSGPAVMEKSLGPRIMGYRYRQRFFCWWLHLLTFSASLFSTSVDHSIRMDRLIQKESVKSDSIVHTNWRIVTSAILWRRLAKHCQRALVFLDKSQTCVDRAGRGEPVLDLRYCWNLRPLCLCAVLHLLALSRCQSGMSSDVDYRKKKADKDEAIC